MTNNYVLDNDKFIITEYDRLPAFSSFLPGIAGKKGIPMWVFYTNRGQAINSFGIHNKGNAIMEFHSANTAYENTSIKGFRTFLRVNDKFYEPFLDASGNATRTISIEQNTITIEEKGNEEGMHISISYYVLPYENIGALVRDVRITNTQAQEVEVEVLDGLPKIIPYGIQNSMFKEMSNLFKSWTEVKNIDHNAPLYTQRSSTDDSAEVKEVEGGYYYVSIMDGQVISPIYDPDVIFDYDSSLVKPLLFAREGLDSVCKKKQYFVNKVPCGFTPCKRKLQKGESLRFTTYMGYAGSMDLLNQKVTQFTQEGYSDIKLEQARNLTRNLTMDVKTHTSSQLFDQYIEQCYLDNFLRGGYPFIFNNDENKKIVHLYSRKHGDPERDYNFFSIAGEYYSQGNGNFRDVCQNRRNDVFFNPLIDDFNIRTFFSLIQMDGYNPLEIRPSTFYIQEKNRKQAEALLSSLVRDKKGILAKLIKKPFTPGMIAQTIAVNGLEVTGDEDYLMEELLKLSNQEIEAGFLEGYWSDHFDYLLDLVETYLAIYPDKKNQLLFTEETYRIYDSVGVVRPRKDTYVMGANGPRQYGSMCHDPQKAAREGFLEKETNWLKTVQDELVTTSLFGKMLILAVNKFALLDNCGMGIEMEGGKPGWNDAMNGLPGLFGSSMAETLELVRLVKFMIEALKGNDSTWKLPEELVDFMGKIERQLLTEQDSFSYWDKIAQIREEYRESIKYCTSGKNRLLDAVRCKDLLELFEAKLERAINKALDAGNGIIPTYFTYEATKYEPVLDEEGNPVLTPYGLPGVRILEFQQNILPCFLEGPARYLSTVGRTENKADEMCRKIKESDIYDKKLNMYKTSVSLEELTMENGRIRAFTPGWLERESIFLHMEYKYFLGMLEAGLYERFWEAVKEAFIPFRNPEEYGRSILENSSFLASGVNPDPNVHGRGFVARLSGSTVEVLSMWIKMFLGTQCFTYSEGSLRLSLRPVLPAWLFDREGTAMFTFLKSTKIIYHNLAGKDTYGENGVTVKSMRINIDGKEIDVIGDTLTNELALAVREGKVSQIDAQMS